MTKLPDDRQYSNTLVLDRTCDVTAWASEDPTRFNLCGAHLELEKNRIVATDGHRMLLVPLPKRLEAQEPPVHQGERPRTSLIIPRATLIEALKSIPKAKNNPTIPDVITVGMMDNGAVNLTSWTKELARVERTAMPVDGKFPDVEQVIPSDPPRARIGLSAQYVKELGETALKLSGEKNLGIELEIRGSLDPVVATFVVGDDQRKATALIMPMRLGSAEIPGLGTKEGLEEAFDALLDRSTDDAEAVLETLQAKLTAARRPSVVNRAVKAEVAA